MSSLKKIILICSLFVISGVTFAVAPSFDNNFAKYLTDSTPDQYGRVETVFNICIDRNLTLMQNIQNIFYPNQIASSTSCGSSAGGQLRDIIKALGLILLVVFIVVAGINFIMNAKEADGSKKAFTSLLYIAYGAFLVFGVTRILGTVLNIGGVSGSAQLTDSLQNGLFLQILSFFKVLAFFGAIIMMVVYGFQIMAAMDKSDKLKTLRKGIVNIILALVLIKVIDYIFYIAQVPNFATQAGDFIVNISIVLGWVLGALFVLAIFYAGFLFITSGGKEDAMKKARSILINIFLVAVVVFLFLLITYQIFNEFA